MTGSDLHFTTAPLAAAWGKTGGPEENQGDTPGSQRCPGGDPGGREKGEDLGCILAGGV